MVTSFISFFLPGRGFDSSCRVGFRPPRGLQLACSSILKARTGGISQGLMAQSKLQKPQGPLQGLSLKVISLLCKGQAFSPNGQSQASRGQGAATAQMATPEEQATVPSLRCQMATGLFS